MRIAVWMVLTGLTVAVLVFSSGASMVEVEPFYPDRSLQRVDSTPPSTPILALKAIWRGRGATELPGDHFVSNSEGDYGTITWTLTFPENEPRQQGRFGYIFHLVDGKLPSGLEFTADAWSTAMRGDSAYPYIAWNDGMSWEQDAFNFRMYVTAIDSAGNESLPSNIIVVADDGKQEERKNVEYEGLYLAYSAVPGGEARWTGTDEAGTMVSLVVRSPRSIEFDTADGIVRGDYVMRLGDERGKPHRIDFFDNIPIGPQIKQQGIYEMHGDSLRLCLAPMGEYRPSTFHDDGATRLYRLRKVSP